MIMHTVYATGLLSFLSRLGSLHYISDNVALESCMFFFFCNAYISVLYNFFLLQAQALKYQAKPRIKK